MYIMVGKEGEKGRKEKERDRERVIKIKMEINLNCGLWVKKFRIRTAILLYKNILPFGAVLFYILNKSVIKQIKLFTLNIVNLLIIVVGIIFGIKYILRIFY